MITTCRRSLVLHLFTLGFFALPSHSFGATLKPNWQLPAYALICSATNERGPIVSGAYNLSVRLTSKNEKIVAISNAETLSVNGQPPPTFSSSTQARLRRLMSNVPPFRVSTETGEVLEVIGLDELKSELSSLYESFEDKKVAEAGKKTLNSPLFDQLIQASVSNYWGMMAGLFYGKEYTKGTETEFSYVVPAGQHSILTQGTFQVMDLRDTPGKIKTVLKLSQDIPPSFLSGIAKKLTGKKIKDLKNKNLAKVTVINSWNDAKSFMPFRVIKREDLVVLSDEGKHRTIKSSTLDLVFHWKMSVNFEPSEREKCKL